jgi:hypothetical protein
MRNVYSSHIDRVGYDDETGRLHVHWSNGSEGYYATPADVARSVLTAPSIGQELHRIVRGSYDFTYTKKGGR